MKKLMSLVAILGMVGLVPSAFAGIQISNDGNRALAQQVLTAVYNNSTANITSGTVVIWDTAGTAGTTLGTYVTTTTTADSSLVAGVVQSDTILTLGIGTICVRGPIQVRFAEATDGATEAAGDRLGTTTVTGQAGVGSRLGVRLQGAVAGSADNELVWIFVDPDNST